MRNILLVVCIPLGLMLTAPSDAQQPVSQKPAQNTSASQNQTELGKLIGTVEQLDKRLERVENRLERVENRQNELDEKMDDKFDELNKQNNAKFERINNRMNTQFERINNRMNAEFKQLNNRMDTMFYWIMGVIVAFGVPMIIPIFIPFALDSYRRWKDSRPSPPSPVSSPQAVSGQESTKQATGGQESAVSPPRPLSES